MKKDILVVDLDGTLIRTDVLFEQLLWLAKTSPWRLPLVFLWLLRGIPDLKCLLANVATIEPATLPYRSEVLQYAHKMKDAGHRVILASGSHRSIVAKIAQHLGLFDGLIATDLTNCIGETKLAAIKESFPTEKFAYVGNSRDDLPIWAASQLAIAVDPTRRIAKALASLAVPVETIRDERPLLSLIAKQLRLHQWVKNLLVFIPLIARHELEGATQLAGAIAAFFAFSFLASSIYLINDLADIGADRSHATKRLRPLASGAISIKAAFALLAGTLGASAAIATFMPWRVQVLLAAYFALNLAYSAKLKEFLIVDTVALTIFYALRILVGGAATHIFVSQWLLAFSVFFFFGLAMVKRFTELSQSKSTDIQRRGYQRRDMLPLLSMGVGSSLLSIMVLALYFNSHDVERLYLHPERLWILTPVLLYWTARVWLLAHREQIADDPVVFALKDRASWGVLVAVAAVLGISI